MTTQPENTFVPYARLREHDVNVTRQGLRKLIAKGEFPPPFELSQNRIAWRLSDILEWKASRPVRHYSGYVKSLPKYQQTVPVAPRRRAKS